MALIENSADLSPDTYPSATNVYLRATPEEVRIAEDIMHTLQEDAVAQEFREQMAAADLEAMYDHCERVGIANVIIGRRLLLEGRQLTVLAASGLFHDIGKKHDSVSPYINDPTFYPHGSPEREEYMSHIRPHALYGGSMIRAFDSWDERLKEPVAAAAEGHHAFHPTDAYGVVPVDPEVREIVEITACSDQIDTQCNPRNYNATILPRTRAQKLEVIRRQFDGSPRILAASEGILRVVTATERVSSHS